MEVSEVKRKLDIKFLFLALSILSWTTVLILHFSSDLSLLIPIVISILITVVYGVSFFFKRIAEGLEKRNKDSMPDPLSEEKVKEILKEIIKARWNYIVGEPLQSVININKNSIYYFKVNSEMEERFGDKFESSCWIVINATYPKIMPCIREGSMKEEEIKSIANSMSNNPKEDPDEEEIIVENPITGTRQTTKKKTHRKVETKEEKEV